MTQAEFEYMADDLRAKAINAAHRFGLNDEAEDVAQDVMLRLWGLCPQLKADASALTLAGLAAKHICIDRWRANTKRRETSVSRLGQDDIHVAMQHTADADQHEELEAKELEEWLQQQIDQLPSTNAIILRMRQIERRELSEIALLLGITQASVSTLLSRARRQLTEQLKKARYL